MMGDTKITTASLKTWVVPCESVSGQQAVWQSDDITIFARVGQRVLCRIEYGAEEFRRVFYTWLPKKWLRRRGSILTANGRVGSD